LSVMTPLNPTEEFLKHAAECELMAKFTRDPKNKATWSPAWQRDGIGVLSCLQAKAWRPTTIRRRSDAGTRPLVGLIIED
jgi:negative regulator of sigma E activity